MYEYYEILGSEKPIYRTKPEGLKTFSEIASADFIEYEIVAYLEYNDAGKDLYEPLYKRVVSNDESVQ